MTETLVRPSSTRGTSKGNQRGSSHDRRSRRAWLVLTYQSNIPGFCRCYRRNNLRPACGHCNSETGGGCRS